MDARHRQLFEQTLSGLESLAIEQEIGTEGEITCVSIMLALQDLALNVYGASHYEFIGILHNAQCDSIPTFERCDIDKHIENCVLGDILRDVQIDNEGVKRESDNVA